MTHSFMRHDSLLCVPHIKLTTADHSFQDTILTLSHLSFLSLSLTHTHTLFFLPSFPPSLLSSFFIPPPLSLRRSLFLFVCLSHVCSLSLAFHHVLSPSCIFSLPLASSLSCVRVRVRSLFLALSSALPSLVPLFLISLPYSTLI